MMTTVPEGMGLVETPLKDLVQENQESGMDNSIVRCGQYPEVLSFPICKKTNILLPELWLTFARKRAGAGMTKPLESAKPSI